MDEWLNKNDPLAQEIIPLLTQMGYQVVEWKANKRKGTLDVLAVLHKPDGLSIADCSCAHKILYPRIQVYADTQNVHLEVASPGINRVFKTCDEFQVFTGKTVALYLKEAGDWVQGVLLNADKDVIQFQKDGVSKIIRYADIQKAKLDVNQEERKQ